MKLILLLSCVMAILSITACKNNPETLHLFPVEHYDQTLAKWINPNDPNYDKPLISHKTQLKQLNQFYRHFFGTLSPWDAQFVQAHLHAVHAIEHEKTTQFSNQNQPPRKIGYGENYRPYTAAWIKNIATNMHLLQFASLYYHPTNRAIAIDNLLARELPTDDVHFYSYKFAGEGYPFDNLQMSAIWIGSPVYIVGETKDHAWSLVLTASYLAWVKSEGLARTDLSFINTWTKAGREHLAAITQTKTAIVTNNGTFIASAYVGSVFPEEERTISDTKIMVPMADTHHNAIIAHALIPSTHAVIMPLVATPHHFADILHTLINRPYGWGNMYFYNDCSSELKSLFTPFGRWLPRNSQEQRNAGKKVEMSSASPTKRVAYLMKNGHPFFTIIYVGGHIILYLGNFPILSNHTLAPLTYQNVWALAPQSDTSRSVIGKSVLLPMLPFYAEDPTLVTDMTDQFFSVTYLD
jgi:cell wall-associated NlpC family hydrolase